MSIIDLILLSMPLIRYGGPSLWRTLAMVGRYRDVAGALELNSMLWRLRSVRSQRVIIIIVAGFLHCQLLGDE